jgi:CHRD domain
MRRFLAFAAVGALALAAFTATTQAQVPAQDELVAGRTVVIPLSGPGGSGTAVFTFNPGLGLVCYTIDVTLSTPGDVPAEPAPGLGSAHIHVRPSGGIFIDLEAQFEPTGAEGGFTASDCVSADREAIVAIFQNPESYYLNVHTVAFPGGAVSGDFG